MSKSVKETVYFSYFESKMGRISLVASNRGLIKTSLPLNSSSKFEEDLHKHYEVKNEKNSILDQACVQLSEFFLYKRKKFDIPYDIQEGTDFQRKVWNQLQMIPYGKTYSYKQIALKINNPGAVRAIGLANKANPLPLFIPCHRVIGSDGSLVGYAGSDPKNLDFKAKLLKFEKSKGGLDSFLEK
jgi:methylated-DNA-[protein]-cysteine S-methyltransferase